MNLVINCITGAAASSFFSAAGGTVGTAALSQKTFDDAMKSQAFMLFYMPAGAPLMARYLRENKH